MPGKFELKKSKDGSYFFNLKSPTGMIILTSQFYDTRENAEKGIETVRSKAGKAGSYEIVVNSSNNAYFIFKENNNELAHSQVYSSKLDAEKTIELTKKLAPGATISKCWGWLGDEKNHRALTALAAVIGAVVAVAMLIIALM